MALNNWGCGITFSVKDGATAAMGRVERSFRSASSAADTAVTKLGRVEKATRLFRAPINLLLNVRDRASSVLARLRRSVFSLQSLMTLSLGAVGVAGAFKGSVGAAAAREQQEVSMLHFLKGDKAKAADMTSWMEDYANKTPFEMQDIFPAGARAIGIAGGDVDKAKTMLRLAGDMAALTPGKTIKDAMEALADAQMGEMERLKEFNFKVTQKEMASMGGYGALMLKMMRHFAGGSEKLSQTAIGQWSTLTDRIQNTLMKAGKGGLDAIKPRLEKINKWFDQNSEKIKAWTEKLQGWFRQFFEFVLGKAEQVGGWLKDNVFDNPAFDKADPARKLEMLWEGARPAVEKVGVGIGKIIGKGIVEGIKVGLGLSVEGLKEMDLSKLLIGGAFAGGILKMTGLWDAIGWAGKMLGGIKALEMTLWTRAIPAVWSFTAALLANPVTWIVLGVVALGAALVLLALNWDKVKAAALRCWEAVKTGAASVRDWVVGKFQDAAAWVTGTWDGLCAWFFSLPGRIGEALAGIGEFLMAPFRAAFDWILGKINAIVSGFNSIKSALGFGGEPGTAAGAATWAPVPAGPPVPVRAHADGGIFSTPHLALFAEDGPEAVVPLSPNRRGQGMGVLGMASAILGAGGRGGETRAPAGQGQVRQPVQIVLDGRVIAETVLSFQEDRDVRRVMPGGWNLNASY